MTTYYVSATGGSDSNSGTSATAAFATLQAAADATKPGDTVEVESGTYSSSGTGGYVLGITHSGTASAPIVFEAAPGAHPIIDMSNQWAGVNIDASYVTVQGFEVVGDARSLTLAQAQAASKGNPVFDGDGITTQNNAGLTHITIANNVVHDTPGGGIIATEADYVTITGNTVYNTAFWSKYEESGISLYSSFNSDSSTATKNFITNNTVYNNKDLVAGSGGTITDGEGIIVDDNNGDQQGQAPYTGRTLVQNNVAYDNGSSGIQSFHSAHVDIWNNTAYGNNTVINQGGDQILLSLSSDVNLQGNALTDPETTPPPPLPAPTPSPDGTEITSPSDPAIIDQSGRSWTLVQSTDSTKGLQIAVNGTVDPITQHVVLLETLNGAMVQENSSGNWYSEVDPVPDGWTQISDPSGGTVTTDKLSLILSEDARRGNAQFVAKVDGTQIGSGTVTASNGSGQTQEFDFSGQWGGGSHTIEIDFTNPAKGRHLYVDQVNYNSTNYMSSPHELVTKTPFNVAVGQ